MAYVFFVICTNDTSNMGAMTYNRSQRWYQLTNAIALHACLLPPSNELQSSKGVSRGFAEDGSKN